MLHDWARATAFLDASEAPVPTRRSSPDACAEARQIRMRHEFESELWVPRRYANFTPSG
jgi:hypothetical protein